MKFGYSGKILARNLEVLDKAVSVSVCTPQIPHEVDWDGNWAFEVTDQ
jgi:hypothetical protein